MPPPPPPPGPPPPPDSPSGYLLTQAASRTSIVGRARRLSSAVATTFLPSVDSDLDVLGLGAPPPPPMGAPQGSVGFYGGIQKSGSIIEETIFDEDDLFTVEVEDSAAGVESMVAGEGLTSPVLQYDENGVLDWAAELLLLTHEPLRRDMLEMLRALQPRYFGDLPEGWRVRAFFRFFTAWCGLVTQQHAIEVAVYYDWLAAPTGKMKGEQRQELLSYHRAIELELLSISRLEKKIIDELAGAADWTTSEPWSEQAQFLRDRLNKLCADIRLHLATQESLLPEVLREHWGRVSPPNLLVKSLSAAKKGQAAAAGGSDKPKLLMWILHYLEKRAPMRAKHVVSSLPMSKRWAITFGRLLLHQKILSYLRAIIDDVAPDEVEEEVVLPARGSTGDGDEEEDDEGAHHNRRGKGLGGTVHEKQRRAGMVNAVLAAANARRVDVPLTDNSMSRALAASEDPLHQFKMDGRWANQAKNVPDNLFKKIGVEQTDAPRRL